MSIVNSGRATVVATAALFVVVAPVPAQVLVECGSPMRYLANSTDPGVGTAWTQRTGFDDSAWTAGTYGVGYDAGDMLQTQVTPGKLSVYTRATFQITGDPQQTVESLLLGVDYDDGYVAWINGVEVARADQMAGRDAAQWNVVSGSHESSNSDSCASQESQIELDVTAVARPVLVSGTNVLAIGTWNRTADSSDLALVPTLELNRPVAPPPAAGVALVECGSPMQYLANNSDPGIGIAWTQGTGFDDSVWLAGTYGVGYGAGGMLTTEVARGTFSVYTRATFQIEGDPQQTVESLLLGVDYDDGYVAWVNGVEVARAGEMGGRDATRWDAGSGSHESSNSGSCASQESQVELDITAIAKPALVSGTNVLAIGTWNRTAGSSDLALVPTLELNRPAPPPPTLAIERGPYLQLATDTSIVVQWRTTLPTNSRVRYGPALDELVLATEDLTERTEHVVSLSGLEPGSTYYYSIGTTTEPLAGSDSEHFFTTNPRPGTVKPFRAWVLGDSGTANNNARAVRDAYYAYTGQRHTDLLLMLGDNAYNSGTDPEYQRAVFEMYPELLRQTVLWPTFGNHEAPSADSPTQSGVYYNIFTLPTAAEAGGLASGTEAYYSFDFANVHFISLDSQDTDRSSDGAMMTWLEADIENTLQDWIVAFWHHPPYSKGSHDSDSANDSGGRLIDMREIALPILEAGGVDLVLSGHSHSYERSYLIDGAYGYGNATPGFATLLANGNILDDGDGRPSDNGAYGKPTAGLAPREGTVYTVAGSSGQVSSRGSLDHPVMVVSHRALGSMVLDFDDLRLDVIFLDDAGNTRDSFTLVKGSCDATGVPGGCDPAELVEVADGLGAAPNEFISPLGEDVPFDAVALQFTTDVELASDVPGLTLTGNGGGKHTLTLATAVTVGQCVQLEFDVDDPATGLTTTVQMTLCHQPLDINQDGTTNIADATAFGDEFNGDKRLVLVDINGDGVVDVRDATAFGNNWIGAGGLQAWQNTSLQP